MLAVLMTEKLALAKLKFLFLKMLYEWIALLVSFSAEGLLDFMNSLYIS